MMNNARSDESGNYKVIAEVGQVSRSNLYSYPVFARGSSPEAILVGLTGMEIATHFSGTHNDKK